MIIPFFVVKNTFLSNSDAEDVRRLLLEKCNVHTILNMPQGTFLGAGVKTVVLFFEKGHSTNKIWYYDLDPGRNLGKTKTVLLRGKVAVDNGETLVEKGYGQFIKRNKVSINI